MGITEKLKKQLNSENENIRQSAKDCIIIAEKLKELDNGSVWSSKWHVLVSMRIKGRYPNCEEWYEPTEIGKIFIKGINS